MLSPCSPQPLAAQGWTGTGEFGLAAARGNARSENLNAKLDFVNEDDRWKHVFGVSMLRAKGEIRGDFDGDGVPETLLETTANRWAANGLQRLQDERACLVDQRAAPRARRLQHLREPEHASRSASATTSTATTKATCTPKSAPATVAPSSPTTGETESSGILRGVLDYRQVLTETTTLTNLLLVESGEDNTFAQNDFGVAVSMTETLALKAGLQARYNSETSPGTKSTDLLTTINLVYAFR
jgi:putative salt-induced outer membrane protein